ncbi:MAG: hypothetical protein QOI80_3610 [Solirubrobacteraceae bacterium]|jgi:hypothetical protein|nr:hypothetical protein [Solirubrobacteraceae bacterium]
MRWALLALLGVVLAASAAYAANQLATQPIGLLSEPISAGDRLAPKARRTAKPKPTRTPTPTPTAPPATPVPTTDDHGGGHGSDDSGGGGNSGHGGGDD